MLKITRMAPISLKGAKIQEMAEELVTAVTGFRKSSRNFTLSVQYALSNFRYHKFLDVNSQKVERTMDGICQKFKVHSQPEKAETLQNLCESFLNSPLNSAPQEPKTDAHYSLLLLLFSLADSPTHVDYTPRQKEEEPEEEWFDWAAYLLDGEEEEILGLPSQQYQTWSDDEDEDLESTSDSGVSVSEQQSSLHQDTPRLTHNDKMAEVREQQISQKERTWISDQIVARYWEDNSFQGTYSYINTSDSGQCSVAESWETFQREHDPFYHHDKKTLLTETQIVRETLWMLSGVEKTYVYTRVSSRSAPEIRENIQVAHLTPECLLSLLSKFSEAGQHVLVLQKFVKLVLDPQMKSTHPTQTLQAFAMALFCYLKKYKELLSSIEKDIVKQEASLSLLQLQSKLGRTLDEVNTLFDVYQSAILDAEELNNAQKTSHLLSAVYNCAVQADGLGSSAKWKVCLLLKIFLQTVEPCLNFVDEWVTSGHVLDPHNEFFIERVQGFRVDSPSFWSEGVSFRSSNYPNSAFFPCFLQNFVEQIIRAGKSVELIQGLGKLSKLHSLKTKVPLYQEFMDHLMASLSTGKETRKQHQLNKEKSILETVACFPPVLSAIKHGGDHVLKLSFMDSSAIMSEVKSSERSWASFHALDLKKVRSHGENLEQIGTGIFNLLKPLELLIMECLTPLLEERCTQASCSLIHLMKTEFKLLDHLAALRNFFLLEAGDAMHQFYVEIFQKARCHDLWQDISFLNSLIAEALQPRFPQSIERLVISLTGGGSSRKQVGQSLQGLALNYKAPWPVNIVIDSSCQKLYNLVFLFLLKLKQAKWSLDELRFSDLIGNKQFIAQQPQDSSDDEEAQYATTNITLPATSDSSPQDQEIVHKMFVFRFSLMQFINSIHNHFMTRILHSTGLEFQDALNKANNLDDLIKAHSSYVEKLYERCLLSQKVGYLREVILKVLNLVLQFQTYWDNGIKHVSQENFKRITEEFSKCNTFLVSCLKNIVKRGAFPHLESLAFDLTSSTSLPLGTPIT